MSRSSGWHRVRADYLEKHPTCAACGADEDLQVHHIKPYHLFPELELVEGNLITLCEKPGHSCHFTFGHLHDWYSYNLAVRDDAEQYLARQQARP